MRSLLAFVHVAPLRHTGTVLRVQQVTYWRGGAALTSNSVHRAGPATLVPASLPPAGGASRAVSSVHTKNAGTWPAFFVCTGWS